MEASGDLQATAECGDGYSTDTAFTAEGEVDQQVQRTDRIVQLAEYVRADTKSCRSGAMARARQTAEPFPNSHLQGATTTTITEPINCMRPTTSNIGWAVPRRLVDLVKIDTLVHTAEDPRLHAPPPAGAPEDSVAAASQSLANGELAQRLAAALRVESIAAHTRRHRVEIVAQQRAREQLQRGRSTATLVSEQTWMAAAAAALADTIDDGSSDDDDIEDELRLASVESVGALITARLRLACHAHRAGTDAADGSNIQRAPAHAGAASTHAVRMIRSEASGSSDDMQHQPHGSAALFALEALCASRAAREKFGQLFPERHAE